MNIGPNDQMPSMIDITPASYGNVFNNGDDQIEQISKFYDEEEIQ